MKNITLVKEETSIKEALKLINKKKFKILFIRNKFKQLSGSLTDGDIRRYLIKNSDLSRYVKFAMKKKPYFVYENNFNEKKIQKILISKNLIQIPILNSNKKIIGIYPLNQKFIKYKKIIFIIMAGGYGKRLLPFTKKKPKPLLSFKGRTLLENAINSAKRSGFNEIYITTHYLSSQIKNFLIKRKQKNIKIIIKTEKKPLGTFGGIKLFDLNQYENIILSNVDVYSSLDYKNLIDFHIQQNNDFTVAIKKVDQEIPFGVIKYNQKSYFKKIEEKPKVNYNINTGIYIFKSNLLKFVKSNRYLDVIDFFEILKTKKKKIGVFPMHEYWEDVSERIKLKLNI